jgi:hypothetical protein
MLFVGRAANAEQGDCSMCVARVPAQPPVTSAPGLLCESGRLSLQVGAQPSIPWPQTDGVRIELPAAGRSYRVTVLCDGKPQQSFRFRFSEFKSKDLCLFINDFYQTIQRWEAGRSPWCKCK